MQIPLGIGCDFHHSQMPTDESRSAPPSLAEVLSDGCDNSRDDIVGSFVGLGSCKIVVG